MEQCWELDGPQPLLEIPNQFLKTFFRFSSSERRELVYGTDVSLKRWRGGIAAIGLFFLLYALALGIMNINGFVFYWYGGEETLQQTQGKTIGHATANSITQGY